MDWKHLLGVVTLSVATFAGLGYEPFWEGEIMYEEPVLFIAGSDDSLPSGRLLAVPRKILKATNRDGSVEYVEGRDFTVDAENKKIILTKNSRITPLLSRELYPPAGAPRSYGKKLNSEQHMFYSEDSYLPDRQVRFTYRHSGLGLASLAKHHYGEMPDTKAKISSGKPVKFFVYGDSISTGCNATSFLRIPPFQPTQYERLIQFLHGTFGSEISWLNFACGGRNAEWGVQNIASIINAKENPDFVILAWGMNDASSDFSAEKFTGLLSEQMQKIRQRFPGVEFLLLTSMPANENWQYAGTRHFPEYSKAVRALANAHGTLVVDTTPIWTEIIRRKGFMSLTGNGLNHPNDFGHRIYADMLITAFLHPAGR